MAESSWPSPSNDRLVDDAQYEKLGISTGPRFGGVFGDFTSPQLIYGDSTGRQIKVAADRYAWVRGHEWWSGSSIVTVAIAANASGSTRTDLVVLRLSRTTWDVTLAVVQGTAGAGVPALTQATGTTGVWELPLATVSVANGASTISAANVTYVAPHLASDGSYRVPTEAALTYIPSPLSGDRATLPSGQTFSYDGSAWRMLFTPAATSYTPTWGGASGNPSVGNGSITGSYVRVGNNLLQVQIALTIGSTSTGGTGRWTFSLPVAPSEQTVFAAICEDASATTRYGGSAWVTPGTGVFAVALGSGMNGISSTNPMTWGVGDQLYLNGIYRY